MTTYRAPAPRPDETWEPVRAFSPTNTTDLVGALLEAERQRRADARPGGFATGEVATDDEECP
jgi:hypothetical protein